MEIPCECGIKPPGSISHGVNYYNRGLFEIIVVRVYGITPEFREPKKLSQFLAVECFLATQFTGSFDVLF